MWKKTLTWKLLIYKSSVNFRDQEEVAGTNVVEVLDGEDVEVELVVL